MVNKGATPPSYSRRLFTTSFGQWQSHGGHAAGVMGRLLILTSGPETWALLRLVYIDC